MKEETIEEYLTNMVRRLGGWCFKFAPISFVGVPDRIILMPGGRIGFLELKRPGEEPRPNQLGWINRLRLLGFVADWTASRAGVDDFVRKVLRIPDRTAP